MAVNERKVVSLKAVGSGKPRTAARVIHGSASETPPSRLGIKCGKVPISERQLLLTEGDFI